MKNDLLPTVRMARYRQGVSSVTMNLYAHFGVQSGEVMLVGGSSFWFIEAKVSLVGEDQVCCHQASMKH